MWTKMRVVLSVLPMLAACGVDPGDLAAFERFEVESAAVIGTPFQSVAPALLATGYSCETRTGSFITEVGAMASAPEFLFCHKLTARTPSIDCSIRTHVIVVPEGARVAQVHFAAGYRCV
jgi:hypothetical protein